MTQDSYMPPKVDPNLIIPPLGTQFANATWLPAGPVEREIVERVLGFEELSELADVPYEVRWRRLGSPMLNKARGDALYARAQITPPRYVWEAKQREDLTYPHYILDLFWKHFDDMRRGHQPGEDEPEEERAEAATAMYVHRQVLEQHVHHALMALSVDADIIRHRAIDYAGYAETLRRYGQWSSGAVVVARQLEMFSGEQGIASRPLHEQAQD